MKLLFSILCIIYFQFSGFSQKTLNALRIDDKITIDGVGNEAIWDKAEIASDFTTVSPEYGKTPEQSSIVKVLYDDEALYILAVMDEVSRDSIMTELSQRDEVGNTDNFAVLLDTYGNGTDGVVFVVGSTGGQYDALKENSGNEDTSWDAVWESNVDLTANGWTCEIRLPYSAIRFPKKDVQEWSINFSRRQARKNMVSLWNPQDPEINGIFTQSGKLVNIKNIKPPLRLSLSPYFSAYAIHNHDVNNNPVNNTGYTYNGGMDVKYGINDAFTLDMTLIPDFGQVESDDNVVNLSPFEVRFDEKRPFFTEGLELFNKASIFYTRRIGGRPLNTDAVSENLQQNEIIESNPSIPQLYNATKVSGRNSNGLAIGVFNAVEASTSAIIRNTETNEAREYKTQPLTNYSVIVFDQNLKNNSSVSIINTNVWRQGKEFYDANVTGLDFSLKDKNQDFEFAGEAAYSLQSFSDIENNTGHKLELEFSRISGKINYWVDYSEESPNYDPNDLGFLRAANSRNFGTGASYNMFDPFGSFNRAEFWTNFSYQRIVEPDAFTGWRINIGGWAQTKSFWSINSWANFSPVRHDYFEPRVQGRFVTTPGFYNTGFNINSDGRKKFQMSTFSYIYNVGEAGRWGYEIGVNPRYRFSDKFSLELDSEYEIQYDDTGWVDEGDNAEIIFGQRDRLRIENLVGLNYNFTEKIGLNLRVRHYWLRALYQSYHELNLDGTLGDTDYNELNDFEYTYFNLDLNFNWRFAPGSDIFINWKNQIDGGHDRDLFNISDIDYIKGIGNLHKYPQQNSISIRLVYYLDYQNFKNWI